MGATSANRSIGHAASLSSPCSPDDGSRFETGLCLLDAASGRVQSEVVDTSVTFRPLGPGEIEAYVDREQALDCAGGFKCEGLGIALVESIRGDDPTALEGLPLIALARMLRKEGMDPLAPSAASAGPPRGG